MATVKSTSVLEMVFKTATGKDVTYSMSDPKTDLTKAKVDTYMGNVVTKNVFANKAGDLTSAVKSQVVETTVTALV